MSDMITISGVPRSIATDGWWLASDAAPSEQDTPPPDKRDRSIHAPIWATGMGGIIFLILLGDFLFWGYWPGFTLAIFAMAVFGVAAMRYGGQQSVVRPAILMGLSVLPVIEHVQTLSVCILLVGGLSALGWLRVISEGGFFWITAAALRLLQTLPFSGVRAVLALFQSPEMDAEIGRGLTKMRAGMAKIQVGSLWRNWAFPIGGAMVLGALLLSANPVLARLLSQIIKLNFDGFELLTRAMFWSGLGLLIWPLVNPPMPQHETTFKAPSIKLNFGINCGSVLRALMVFNVFLAVQSLLDFSILLGGADLPRGMSYATYAHRGAYPLLATAMLAGVFTFAARPFLNEHQLIKPLLLLWVAQNVLLTFAAVLRLELYIAQFGLTYMRMYALIWMALVAIGLVTVLWHVLRGLSQNLLLGRLSALGCGTLYLCAFVNFSALIATDTLNRAAYPQTSSSIDWQYLCQLGPTATKAIEKGLIVHPEIGAIPTRYSCAGSGFPKGNWRELDFRKIRTHGYALKRY